MNALRHRSLPEKCSRLNQEGKREKKGVKDVEWDEGVFFTLKQEKASNRPDVFRLHLARNACLLLTKLWRHDAATIYSTINTNG